MENSSIEWTNSTFNPWHGCMKVSEGCKNCYAETMDNRWKGGHWGPNSPRKPMSEAYWQQPFKWNEAARKAGVKTKVFCASMADVFEDHPQVVEWRERLFAVIADTPHLIWQLLTKRPENILKFVSTQWIMEQWPSNVWIGTSVENQAAADERIPHLLKVPANVRFLSCEPLLAPVNLSIHRDGDYRLNTLSGRWISNYSNQPLEISHNSKSTINWVICGGESGPKARPMHSAWARSLRDQCQAAGVPFFFKQWGEYWPAGTSILDGKEQVLFGNEPMYRLGKKSAGSVLDGSEWKEFPNE